jgi:Glycosyltransferase family 87/WD40-like Beta Propeller Repeat
MTRMCALLAFAIFLATSFRAGWTRSETDFPNYYTAAVLVRNGARLQNYYDWTWFQKQMNYAGIENQLGGYIPQTPLTMMPFLGMAGCTPQVAKRIWLLLNLAFLIGTFWILSRITRFSMAQVALLAFLGYGTLHANFLLGQYYVFLLFLLVVAFYFLKQEKARCSGCLLGTAFALKLYGGPFLLYFAAKRHWRLAIAMLLTIIGSVVLAIAIFGWRDIAYFGTQILPRALEGETLDPYNSGNGTLSTLLRRSFVMEPELNPHPFRNAPVIYFFLQPFLTLGILMLPLLVLRRSNLLNRDFAWFFLALILASPNTASYTFILLLLPVLLLLEEATTNERVFLIGCYLLLTLPVLSRWNWLFPKVWLLVLLFGFAARPYAPLFRAKSSLAAILVIGMFAALTGRQRLASYLKEPGRRWERVALQQGAIYSSSPAVVRSGLVYESIGRVHYVLRWLHAGRIDELPFAGEAFHPIARCPDGPIQFELVAGRTSKIMLFDLSTRTLVPQSPPARSDATLSLVSPDGKWIVYTGLTRGSKQIWVRRVGGGPSIPVTGGNCNSFSPAWELDSKAIVFASDCDRGIGLPALYRAPLDRLQSPG